MIPQLTAALQGGAPLVYIHSPEEERILRELRQIAEQDGRPLRTWSCLSGLQHEMDETRDAATAIITALQHPQSEILVFLDLSPFLHEPHTIRALREAYAESKNVKGRVFVLLCADLVLPDSLMALPKIWVILKGMRPMTMTDK